MNTNGTIVNDNGPEVVSIAPPEIEEDILISFGHAIVEFEDTLYIKFLHLPKDVTLTKREFIGHLEDMEERGIVASGILLGRRCWSMGSDRSAVFDEQ